VYEGGGALSRRTWPHTGDESCIFIVGVEESIRGAVRDRHDGGECRVRSRVVVDITLRRIKNFVNCASAKQL